MQTGLIHALKVILRIFSKEQYVQSGVQYSPGPVLSLVKIVRLIWNRGRYRSISPNQLHKIMRMHHSLTILDIRSRQAFEQGHIRNAVNIPLKNIIMAESLPFSKTTEIIVTCYLGVTSREVISLLSAQGYRNLINLNGGMGAWKYEREQ